MNISKYVCSTNYTNIKKLIFEKCEINPKNLLGVFFTDMISVKKNPIAKIIIFCKINICEKDPQVPEKGV